MKYPDIHVKLSGEDGNAFNIMGRVQLAMKDAGLPVEERNAFFEEASSGDYDNVIQTAMRWVNVS